MCVHISPKISSLNDPWLFPKIKNEKLLTVSTSGGISGDSPGVLATSSGDVGGNDTDGLKSVRGTLSKLNLSKSGGSGVNPGDQSLATSSVDGAGKGGCDGDRGSSLSADSSNGKSSDGGNNGLHVRNIRREER